MSKLYVVVAIGCLECQKQSELLGVFTDRAAALETGAEPAAEMAYSDYDGGDWFAPDGGPLKVMFEAEVP